MHSKQNWGLNNIYQVKISLDISGNFNLILKQLVFDVVFRKRWEDWIQIGKNWILTLTLIFADSVALGKPSNLLTFSFLIFCTCTEHVPGMVFIKLWVVSGNRLNGLQLALFLTHQNMIQNIRVYFM